MWQYKRGCQAPRSDAAAKEAYWEDDAVDGSSPDWGIDASDGVATDDDGPEDNDRGGNPRMMDVGL